MNYMLGNYYKTISVRKLYYISDKVILISRVDMPGIANKILKRIQGHGRGQWVCSARDFLDIGNRAAIDKALSRLVQEGHLRRISRGLYELPRISRILNKPAPANLDAAIAAITRRDGIRLMPDGLTAANQLGLTTAVPATNSYVTDGTSKTIDIDGRTIYMRHASPRVMRWWGRPSAPVVQAIYWLGPNAVKDPDVIATLKHCLPDDIKQNLIQHKVDFPAWATFIIHQLTTDRAEAA